MTNPLPNDSQPMKGATNGEHRVDVGECRIVYRFDDALVEILIIGKRNDDEIYKEWRRTS